MGKESVAGVAARRPIGPDIYGKRPGPGMTLDKQSLQFSLHETGRQNDVLEAYERLIYDAMVGC